MITHKIGDSIKWKIKSTQSDGTPINWATAIIETKAVDKFSGKILFEFSTITGDSNRYITTEDLNISIPTVSEIAETTAIKVWNEPNKLITGSTGNVLTPSQIDKLNKTSTKQDVYNAALI